MIIDQAIYLDDRAYRIEKDGQIFVIPSVTTQQGVEEKPFLLKYYADLGWDNARKNLHESGERGKRIHFALWCYLNKGAVLYNPWQNPNYSDEQIAEVAKKTNGIYMVLKNQDEMVAMWKLQQFFDLVKPKIIHTEKAVYSIPDYIAGTMDIALELEAGKYPVNGSKPLVIEKSGIYIADLKSGNYVDPEKVWTQLAPYSHAYEQMGLGEVQGAMVLHTSASTQGQIEGFKCLVRTKEELKPDLEVFRHLSAVFRARNPNFTVKAFSFPIFISKEMSKEK